MSDMIRIFKYGCFIQLVGNIPCAVHDPCNRNGVVLRVDGIEDKIVSHKKKTDALTVPGSSLQRVFLSSNDSSERTTDMILSVVSQAVNVYATFTILTVSSSRLQHRQQIQHVQSECRPSKASFLHRTVPSQGQ